MTNITSALVIKARTVIDIGLGNVRLESDLDAKPGCDGN
jgi:beta-glucosidase